jgi:hypothetical protein
LLLHDNLDTYETGEYPWWHDSRNVTALAAWLVGRDGTAAEVFKVFEHPDLCDHLWESYRTWVATADEHR